MCTNEKRNKRLHLSDSGHLQPYSQLYLSLGTNLGDKHENLRTALRLIGERIGTISGESSIMETSPWGYESSNLFLNMAVEVKTNKDPFEILDITREIEREMGRNRKSQNGYADRIIDIDLILYDQQIIDSQFLQLPHPLLHLREFVLKPLCEIAPDQKHPILEKTISELYGLQLEVFKQI